MVGLLLFSSWFSDEFLLWLGKIYKLTNYIIGVNGLFTWTPLYKNQNVKIFYDSAVSSVSDYMNNSLDLINSKVPRYQGN